MKVTWYLPTKHELDANVVFGGPLKIDWHNKGTRERFMATVRDTRRGYNLVRVDFADEPQEDRKVFMENLMLIAERNLDAIRNGHGTSIQYATDSGF